MFGFTLAYVRGDSMSPRLHDGQVKLFRRRKAYQVGDIVLAEHPSLGLIIKQIQGLESGFLTLRGLNSASISATKIGQIPVERVVGRLVN
ncbi:MAG: S24/S26 family peptidase [Pseudomonadota bacterium]